MNARDPSIGRGAIIAACNLFEYVETNAELLSMLLEYDLSDHVASRGSISKTVLALKEFAAEEPNYPVATDFGKKPLSVVLVEEAIRRVEWTSRTSPHWEKLDRYLNLDGYALVKEAAEGWGRATAKVTGFTVAMPRFVEVPESASEVDELLSRYELKTATRHLQSAKENIAQRDWEAANSQCRTFLEALTDGIADRLYPTEAAGKSSGLQKRQLLAHNGFLAVEKHEFGEGGGQTFLPGLAKLLHSDGSHPGISTQHDAMFRLQVVVVTARWLLKRLPYTVAGQTE